MKYLCKCDGSLSCGKYVVWLRCFQSWQHYKGDVTLFFFKPNNWFSYLRRFINYVTIINLVYDYDHLTRYFGLLPEFIL